MDRSLDYDEHVKSVCSKCVGILIGLARVRRCVPKRVLPKFVRGLVFSLIQYCLPIYGSCKKESRRRMQSVVNFGARVISGRRKRDHISDVTRELKWLPVSDLYSFHALCLLKRLLQNGEPRSLARKLVRRGEVRQPRTRQDNKLDLPKIRTEYDRCRIFYRTVDAFNRLRHRLPRAASACLNAVWRGISWVRTNVQCMHVRLAFFMFCHVRVCVTLIYLWTKPALTRGMKNHLSIACQLIGCSWE